MSSINFIGKASAIMSHMGNVGSKLSTAPLCYSALTLDELDSLTLPDVKWLNVIFEQ